MHDKARTFRRMEMGLLDILYPNCCPCCGKSIPWQDYLCESCRMQIDMPADAFCPYCGKELRDCMCSEMLSYDRAAVLTVYEGAARQGILSLKQASSLHFARYCASCLADRILQDPQLCSYDSIVPIPMYWRKQIHRYCNPAAVFAKELSRITRIPMRKNLLWDDGTGNVQHTLSAKERAKNVKHFHIYPIDLTGYRILLCDDILTTTSTMCYCASLLKSQGAVEVAAISMATTRSIRSVQESEV